MKIYLVDNTESGHHKTYQEALNKIDNTIIKNQIINFTSVKKNIIMAFIERKKFIKNVSTNKKDIIHFLYLDSLYKCPFIAVTLNRNNTYIGTLHWIPTNLFNQILLKNFSKNMKYIIVHSEYLKLQLLKLKITNVIVVDYPSFLECEANLDTENKFEEDDSIKITCLGGTRYDKGLDILSNAFDYIKEDKKQHLIFNICGIEQDIKYSLIEESAKRNNINIILKNTFLTDEQYYKEINDSDVILVPYRKIFAGNSGPMTDGIYMRKFMVGPNYGNLGYLINTYKLGKTFEVENSYSLAKVISNLNKTNLKIENLYREKISLKEFIQKHKEIYSKVCIS